jgi:hypothetical protein
LSSTSPSRAFNRSLSSVSPSVGRAAKAASPAARNESRHEVSVAAVTPSERDTVSISSARLSAASLAAIRARLPIDEPNEATDKGGNAIELAVLQKALHEGSQPGVTAEAQ